MSLFSAVIVGYIILLISFLIIWILPIGKVLPDSVLRQVLSSLASALLFGIGFAASGGDPGFALPVPIFIALFWTNPQLIVNSAIIPLLFWWGLIFLVSHLRRMSKRRSEDK
jgi:hypothetical protein